MSDVSQRVAQWMLRRRWWLLAGAIACGLAAWIPARQLEFDRSIEDMYAHDDPLVAAYRKLERVFGGNEIVLAVYQDEQLFAPDGTGLARCGAIRRQLSKVRGVQGVLSIDMPIGQQIANPESQLAERFRVLFEGYTHGRDGKTVAIVCLLAREDAEPRRRTIDELRDIMQNLPDGLAAGLLAGEPVMVVDGFRYLERDGRRLGIASTLLLALTIIVCFRSIRWVIIPIAVVQLAIVATRAILWASGMRLTMVSSMLTAVVTVIGVATVVHVIVRFQDARRTGMEPHQALGHTTTLLMAPIFWSCLTDAVGFASLTVVDVGPVRDYGIMMAIGSLLVLLSVAAVIPAVATVGRWDAAPRQAWGQRLLDVQLGHWATWSRRYPLRVGLTAALVALVVSAGVFRLEVETDFTKNFRLVSPIARSYQMVETHLGGAGVFDVILPAPSRLDWKYLRNVLRLEERLRREVVLASANQSVTAGLTKVISLADAVVAAVPLSADSDPPEFLANTLVRTAVPMMRHRMPEFFQALYGEDPHERGQYYLRVMLRAHEQQPSEAKRELLRQVAEISRQEFAQAEMAGLFVLLTRLIDSVIRDQWLTFALSVLGVGLMMVVAFRSLSLAIVALVPNSIPILVVMGLMGWLGLKINLGAAMIAAVSMGLSIDSSIHYISSFRRARAEGNSVEKALDSVQQTVGRAMVFSTLALMVGFSVLSASEFIPTVYFGLLVSLSMLGGLAGNLVVLPLLLTIVAKD